MVVVYGSDAKAKGRSHRFARLPCEQAAAQRAKDSQSTPCRAEAQAPLSNPQSRGPLFDSTPGLIATLLRSSQSAYSGGDSRAGPAEEKSSCERRAVRASSVPSSGRFCKKHPAKRHGPYARRNAAKNSARTLRLACAAAEVTPSKAVPPPNSEHDISLRWQEAVGHLEALLAQEGCEILEENTFVTICENTHVLPRRCRSVPCSPHLWPRASDLSPVADLEAGLSLWAEDAAVDGNINNDGRNSTTSSNTIIVSVESPCAVLGSAMASASANATPELCRRPVLVCDVESNDVFPPQPQLMRLEQNELSPAAARLDDTIGSDNASDPMQNRSAMPEVPVPIETDFPPESLEHGPVDDMVRWLFHNAVRSNSRIRTLEQRVADLEAENAELRASRQTLSAISSDILAAGTTTVDFTTTVALVAPDGRGISSELSTESPSKSTSVAGVAHGVGSAKKSTEIKTCTDLHSCNTDQICDVLETEDLRVTEVVFPAEMQNELLQDVCRETCVGEARFAAAEHEAELAIEGYHVQDLGSVDMAALDATPLLESAPDLVSVDKAPRRIKKRAAKVERKGDLKAPAAASPKYLPSVQALFGGAPGAISFALGGSG